MSVLRRLLRERAIERPAAHDAARTFSDAPLVRIPHRPLIDRVWDLRDVLSPYDAAYVAVAEMFNAPLLTCDTRLRADVVVFARS